MKVIDFLFWLKGFLDGMPTDDLRFETIKKELKTTTGIFNEPPTIVQFPKINNRDATKKEEPLNFSDVAYIIDSHRRD